MAAKNIQSDDLILVNRGGVDYQAKVSDLPIEDVDLSAYAKASDIKDGKLTIKDSDGAIVEEFTANQSGSSVVSLPAETEIKRWNPPTAGTLEMEEVPGLWGTGVSACRGDGWGEHQSISDPVHVQYPDASHHYMLLCVCGGGHTGEPGYIIELDNDLNFVRQIDIPGPTQTIGDAHFYSFPSGWPTAVDEQEAGYIANMLVFTQPDGIWCSSDYGKNWHKLEDKNGGGRVFTNKNTKIQYTLNGEQIERHIMFFNEVYNADPDIFAFDGFTIEKYPHHTKYSSSEDELYTADNQDEAGISWKSLSMDTGELYLLSEQHAWQRYLFRHAEQDPWGSFTGMQGDIDWFFCMKPGDQTWEVKDGWDKFPSMVIFQYQQMVVQRYEETVFKKWVQSFPEAYIKDDGKYYLANWAMAWDVGTESFICRYNQGRDGLFQHGNSEWYVVNQMLFTRNFREAWLPYYAGIAHEVDEKAVMLRPDGTRSEDTEVASGDGDFTEDAIYASVHRLPGSTTGFLVTQEYVYAIDSVVNGAFDNWGWHFSHYESNNRSLVSLKDGRVWQENFVTKEPFYSTKKGLLIDGHFIEQPAYEVGTTLTGFMEDADGGGADVDLSGYYTKGESDNKFMPLNIKTLPTLN